jgi:hypothetical protein
MPAPKGNKFWMLAKLGSKPMYSDPEEMKKLMLEYFQKCYKRGKCSATISGLAFYLGFQSRDTFYEYEKKEAFTDIIKQARLFIENCYENQLFTDRPTGAIFALKNMGWKDKTETESKVAFVKAEIEVKDTDVKLASSEKDIDL